jgi:hypothetical protein
MRKKEMNHAVPSRGPYGKVKIISTEEKVKKKPYKNYSRAIKKEKFRYETEENISIFGVAENIVTGGFRVG